MRIFPENLGFYIGLIYMVGTSNLGSEMAIDLICQAVYPTINQLRQLGNKQTPTMVILYPLYPPYKII